MQHWTLDPLDPYAYDFVMVDFPWKLDAYSDKGKLKHPDRHYKTLTIPEIKRDFPSLADLGTQHSIFWIWATNPMLDQQIDLMKYYGIKYVTCGVWVKRTRHGKIAFGTGYRLRGSHEPFLIGTIGQPESSKSIRSVIEGKVRENSRKPEEAYVVAEKMMPHANRRADVFARQVRPGWEAFGNETGKFAA